MHAPPLRVGSDASHRHPPGLSDPPPMSLPEPYPPSVNPSRPACTLLLCLGLCFTSCTLDSPEDPSPSSGSPTVSKGDAGSDGVIRDEAGIPVGAPVSQAARDEIKAFVEAMIPPPLEETSDLHDQWLHRTRALIKDLETRGEELGHAALHAFSGEVSDRTVTRHALLSIGARCAPESAAPLLNELMGTYGYRIDDRTSAATLLAEADPALFMQSAGPHLRRRERASKTMPPDEFLIRGWVTACAKSGKSAVDMCADVATNLVIDPPARYAATEALGKFPHDPLAREALKANLVESTGDSYLRRKAAQAIRVSFNHEEACALFSHVLSLEVDATFAAFLTDMLQSMGCR